MRTDFETVPTGQALMQQIDVHHRAGCHIMLHGAPGTGKSDHFAEYSQAAGIGLVVLNLAVCDATDLAGLPFLRDGRTFHATPEFWPVAGAPHGGIVLIEELNRADPTTVAPLYNLITLGRLGGYCLPPGWTFGACVNDEGQVYPIDPALFDRFGHFTVRPDRQAWLQFAARAEMHPAVVRYVEALPDSEFGVDPSPRAWAFASRVLRRAEATPTVTPAELRTALAGWLGRDTAARLTLSMRSGEQGLSGDDVLTAYGSYRATVQGWVKSGRADLLSLTLANVERQARLPGAVARMGNPMRHLTQFVSDLQGDLRERGVALVKALALGGTP